AAQIRPGQVDHPGRVTRREDLLPHLVVRRAPRQDGESLRARRQQQRRYLVLVEGGNVCPGQLCGLPLGRRLARRAPPATGQHEVVQRGVDVPPDDAAAPRDPPLEAGRLDVP